MKALVLLFSLSLVLVAMPARAANCVVVEAPSFGAVGDGTLRAGLLVACSGPDLRAGFTEQTTYIFTGQTPQDRRTAIVAAVTAIANRWSIYVDGISWGPEKINAPSGQTTPAGQPLTSKL